MNTATNPDHHLWNNNGTWWCHFTVHDSGHTKRRVRLSLRTRDLATARQRRDLLLRSVAGITRRIPAAGPAVALRQRATSPRRGPARTAPAAALAG